MTAKTLDAPIAAHIGTGAHTLAWALEVVSVYGPTIRYCSGTRNVTIGGFLFTAADGMSISTIAATVGLSVDNGKVTVGDGTTIDRAGIYDGVWDAAAYRLFQYNWASPSDGIIPWSYGWVADAEPRVGAFDLEFRDLRQALQQDTTRMHQYACPSVLGDANCRKPLAAFTFGAVAITAVTSQRVFAASSLLQAADYFTEGRLIFNTGANANGITRQIQAHATGGAITLVRALPFPALVGDLMTIIAGCRHRPNEDCRDKFSNKVNNGGCDTKPSVSDVVNGALAP